MKTRWRKFTAYCGRHKFVSGFVFITLFLYALGSLTPTEPEFKPINMPSVKVKPEIKRITETKEVVKNVIPVSCLDAIKIQGQLNNATAKMYNIGDEQLSIISEVRVAVASNDNAALVKQAERQMLLEDLTNEIADTITSLRDPLRAAGEKCQSEIR